MRTVTITGASDDLIEIGGDISDEIGHYSSDEDDKGKVLAFSDGTVLRVHYDKDGIWRVARIAEGGAGFEKSEGDVEKDTNDIVTLRGDLRWLVVGDQFIKE